jgi:23S rRNA (uracil1939-C5)-methyltransferase
MAKKNKQFTLYNLSIDTAGNDGRSVGRENDMVVFVENAVPGDVVDAFVYRKKRRFAEARATVFHTLSPHRVEPVCSHFGVCGGCKWQNLNYEKQLEFKQNHVVDCLTRLIKIELPEILPIIGSEKKYFYRNKLEFTFSNKKWLINKDEDNTDTNSNALGFHIPGRFDKILQIDKCYLQDDLHNQIRNFIYNYAVENNIYFFDLREQKGLLRTMMVRNTQKGEWLVMIMFFKNEELIIKEILKALETKFPEIDNILYVINEKQNDTFFDLETITYKGVGYLTEEMEGLKFRINPKAFYQTNPSQAYILYQVARDFAGLTGQELVYDLYTGTGTIANFVAHKAKQVIGVEYVKEAIDDAIINSEINNVHNTKFFAGDMKDVLNDEFIATHGKPQVIITDPPRTGMHESVVNKILEIAPQKVVYVSCNPATQARDLALMDAKYIVTKVQPVDMFPQTHHIENVVLLELRK